jgi:hypothetical protein
MPQRHRSVSPSPPPPLRLRRYVPRQVPRWLRIRFLHRLDIQRLITSNGLYTIMCYRAMVTAQAMNASSKVVNRMFEVHIESCDNDDCDIIARTAAVEAICAINADVGNSFDWIIATKLYGVLM